MSAWEGSKWQEAQEASAARGEETKKRGAPVDRSPDDPPPLMDDRPLVDWIPIAIKGADSPFHLEPLPSLLDAAFRGESVRALASCPIRHWKSSTVKAAVAKGLRANPRLHVILMTHGHDFAQSYGRELRELCRACGVRIARGADTILDWRTEEGGGCFVMSNKQSALGRPCDVFVFDDPFGSFEEADNVDTRQHVDWIIAQYTARLNPGGSVIGVMSRLHPDDAIGRRLERKAREWTYVHKQALQNEGEPNEQALAPHVMSLEHLRAARAELFEADPSERTWHSQFQNDPREGTRGSFKGVSYVEALPDLASCRTAIGLDAAYSEGSSSDFFAAVVLHELASGVLLVGHVERHRRGIDGVSGALDELRARYPDAPMFSYVQGPEVGVYRQLASPRVDFNDDGSQRVRHGHIVHTMTAQWSKEVRARPMAAAWERKLVRVLAGQPWTSAYVRELNAFTGTGGREVDDQVDASVSAYDGLRRRLSLSGAFTRGRRVM